MARQRLGLINREAESGGETSTNRWKWSVVPSLCKRRVGEVEHVDIDVDGEVVEQAVVNSVAAPAWSTTVASMAPSGVSERDLLTKLMG